MMRRSIAAIVMLATWSALAAQQSQSPSRPHERGVKTSAAGPHKLRIDLPLLTAGQRFDRITSDGDVSRAQGGLDDLRLFDAAGGELPYLLISPPRRRASWHQGDVLAIAATEKTSGFEIDLGQARDVDAVVIDGLPAPFLKRFILEGSGDRSRWTMLNSQGTLFDLPAERVRQVHAAFVPGSYRYLRVTWDDTNSGRLPLPRGARARESLVQTPAEPLRAPVTGQRQASEPGRSRYRMLLPSSGLPIVALTLDVSAGDVFRTASVMESQFNGARADPVELGRARLVRTQQGAAGASLRIPIQAPRGAELQLVVDDGNNAPLAIDAIAMEFAELPWIYFEAPAGAVTARYGNAAATAPRYDLEARRASINLEAVTEAAWEEPRAVEGAAAPEPPPALPDRGAAVDVSGFQHRRSLPEGPGELVALQLDAAVLAHSRGPSHSFADVRLVDQQGNQVPYLVERRAEPLSLDLALKQANPQVKTLREGTGGNRSIYTVAVPYPNLPNARLVLETSDRVFRRTLQVGVERPPDRRQRDAWFDVLASPGWQHADQSTAAPPLEIPIAAGDQTDILIVIDEGDNRPLPITAVRLLLPSWRLRLFRPAEPLRLIYGKNDIAPPEYDLALLAPAVMGSEARDLSADSETSTAPPPPAVLSPRVFWIGLGMAVVVLLGLIVRLISSATEPPPSPPAP